VTTQPNRIGYLPRNLADELRRWAPPEISGSEMYDLQRLAERIFAAGTDNGWSVGYEEGRDDRKRPNINDVNRLRKALAEEATATSGIAPVISQLLQEFDKTGPLSAPSARVAAEQPTVKDPGPGGPQDGSGCPA
jgi:hypothetical protein